MNDCLLTKFKGVVDNNNLSKLGTVSIPLVSTASNKRVDFKSSVQFSVNISGDGYFSDTTYTHNYGKSIDAGSDGEGGYVARCFLLGVSNGDTLKVEKKYTITTIGANFASPNAKIFDDLLGLDYMISLKEIVLSNKESTDINLNSISEHSPELTNIRVMYNTKASGAVETIVENMIAGGRSSGTLEILAYLSKLTINGSSSWCQDYSTRTETLVITFTSATNVTVTFNNETLATYNGTTWSY